MSDERDLSQRILLGFSKLNYTFDVYENYPRVYYRLSKLLPPAGVVFQEFDLDTRIGCEVLCAAICHSINWDFLRKKIKSKTLNDITWLIPHHLSYITCNDIEALLKEYNKKEYIRAAERSLLLANIGKRLYKDKMSYEDLFFTSGFLRDYDEIKSLVFRLDAFSSDPAEKKFRLLIQSVSDYQEMKVLSNYFEPTIDYHVTRLYIRRGVIHPIRKDAVEFLLNEDIVHRESTVGAIRMVCSESMKDISWLTLIDIKTVSRIEWWVARTVCVNGKPDCYLKSKDAEWVRNGFDKCPFYNICEARNGLNIFLNIDEPKYGGNSY